MTRGGGSGRTVERVVRLVIAAVALVGIRLRSPGTVANAGLAYAGTTLPDLLERRFTVSLRPWQRAYLQSAMATHAVGMVRPYDTVWWWDHLTHLHSATILGGLAHVAARRRETTAGPRVVAVVVVGGVLWELGESLIHRTADRLDLEPLLVTYGRRDTALDLAFDLLGALLVVILGDRLLANLEPDAAN